MTDKKLKTQFWINPATGDREPLKVRSIKDRVQLGKGGAIKGSVNQPAKTPKTLNKTPDK